MFPCMACKNRVGVDDPNKWIFVFLWKSGATTWEVFDNFFDEIGPDMECDDNMMWDWYYMCPNPAYIQSLQATRNATTRIAPTTTPCQATHAPYDKVPNGGLVQEDANTTATTGNSPLPSGNRAADISHTEVTTMPPVQNGCYADLHVALDKHCNDILCLLRTKSPVNEGAIPPKLLIKIHAVTMVKINDSITHAGRNALL